MTETEFESALRKGLGRALQHLRVGGEVHRELVLDAYLNDWRWDRQCEPSRSLYLYEIAQSAGLAEECREGLLHRMLSADTADLLPENVRLACEFALRCDGELREAMYRAFDRCAAAGEFDHGDELIRLDGIDGFLHAARELLPRKNESNGWQFGSWVEELEERDGTEVVSAALRLHAESDPAFAAELEHLRENKAANARKWQKWPEEKPLPTWSDMRALIAANARPRGLGAPVWGMRATDAEIINAARDVAAETDPEQLRKLLFVFHRRPFPLSPCLLTPYLASDEWPLAWQAARVLSNVEHPDVRAAGLAYATNPERVPIAAMLLRSNWQAGDGALLEAMLSIAESPRAADGVGLSILDIAEENADAELIGPLLALYEKGPCSFCRGSAVRLLLLRQDLPPELAEECRFDANLDIREMLVEGPGE